MSKLNFTPERLKEAEARSERRRSLRVRTGLSMTAWATSLVEAIQDLVQEDGEEVMLRGAVVTQLVQGDGVKEELMELKLKMEFIWHLTYKILVKFGLILLTSNQVLLINMEELKKLEVILEKENL